MFVVAASRLPAYGLFYVLFFGLFALAAYAGVSLWRETRRGLAISTLVQGLQTLALGSPLVRLSFEAGPNAGFSLALAPDIQFRLFVGWGSSFWFYVGPHSPTPPGSPFDAGASFFVGVNLVAVVAMCFLLAQLTDPAAKSAAPR